jgi:hypothetical protein
VGIRFTVIEETAPRSRYQRTRKAPHEFAVAQGSFQLRAAEHYRRRRPGQDGLADFEIRVPADVALPALTPAIEQVALGPLHRDERQAHMARQALAVGKRRLLSQHAQVAVDAQLRPTVAAAIQLGVALTTWVGENGEV